MWLGVDWPASPIHFHILQTHDQAAFVLYRHSQDRTGQDGASRKGSHRRAVQRMRCDDGPIRFVGGQGGRVGRLGSFIFETPTPDILGFSDISYERWRLISSLDPEDVVEQPLY